MNEADVDAAKRFLVLRKKIDDAITPGGHMDDIQRVELTKWDLAFIGAALDEILEAKPLDPRDPDYSLPGVFATHNCWRCKDGKEPCVKGEPRNCDNLHARND